MRLALSLTVLLCLLWGAEANARPVPASEPGDRPARSGEVLEILVLHATNAKKGIDARLKDLPELAKAPFSAYDSYAILQRARLPLALKETKTHRLPNGRSLGAELLEVQKDDVCRLSASITEPGGSAFLPLLEVRAKVGQRFIVAGQKYKSGILVLVLTLAR
jgi:hypothetical protein